MGQAEHQARSSPRLSVKIVNFRNSLPTPSSAAPPTAHSHPTDASSQLIRPAIGNGSLIPRLQIPQGTSQRHCDQSTKSPARSPSMDPSRGVKRPQPDDDEAQAPWPVRHHSSHTSSQQNGVRKKRHASPVQNARTDSPTAMPNGSRDGQNTTSPITPTSAHPPNWAPSIPIPQQVAQIASRALCTGQGLFENAWHVTCTHVQTEMAKMHFHYVNVLNKEKETVQVAQATIARLQSELVALGEQTEKLKADAAYEKSLLIKGNHTFLQRLGEGGGKRNLIDENCKLMEENRRLMEENSMLRQDYDSATALKFNLEQTNAILAEEVRKLRSISPSKTNSTSDAPSWNTTRTTSSEPRNRLEAELTSSLADAHEQRARRLEAERKLLEVQKQLRALAGDFHDHVSHQAKTAVRSNISEPLSSPNTPSLPRTSHGLIDADEDGPMSCETPSTPRAAEALKIEKASFEKRSPRFTSSPSPSSARMDDFFSSPKRSRTNVDKASAHDKHLVSQNEPARERFSASEADQRLVKTRNVSLEDGEILERGSRADSPVSGMNSRRETHLEESEEEDKHRSHLQKSPDTRSSTHTTRSNTPHSPSKVRKLSINHMDLLFLATQDELHCRMCIHRRQQQGGSEPLATFPANSSWAVLIGHCKSDHQIACEELEKLSPSQVVELRHRIKN